MLKSIQILRALAALLVVFAHFEYVKPVVGSCGVDIFFVISGFIMAYIVNKSADSFLYRRIIRIIPLYYAVTFFTAGLYLVKPSWFRNVVFTPEALVKSLLFIPYQIKNSGPILTLGWTLNYEMFFYLCIAFFSRLWGGRKGIIACFIALSLFVLVSYLITWDSYAMRTWGNRIIMEFVGGGILYYVWKNQLSTAHQAIKNALVFVGLAAFVFLLYAEYTYGTSSQRFLLFGIPAFFIACGFLMLESRISSKNRLHSLLVLLGDSSYAIYLIHPFVIYAVQRLIYVRISPFGPVQEFFGLIFAMAAVCLVGVVVHKSFEIPVIQFLKSHLDKRFDVRKQVR